SVQQPDALLAGWRQGDGHHGTVALPMQIPAGGRRIAVTDPKHHDTADLASGISRPEIVETLRPASPRIRAMEGAAPSRPSRISSSRAFIRLIRLRVTRGLA